MFIIFGRDIKIKRVGYTEKKCACNKCKMSNNWPLVKTTKCLTLFFIPIIPYGKDESYICPVCGHSVPLNGVNGRKMMRFTTYYK